MAGGCVRDHLLGKVPKDWDIATDARPEQVQGIFRRTVAVGAAFGVVRVIRKPGFEYEVATYRADGEYVDGRRPTEVHYSKSRREDVERRDLTINALLMDPESGEIEDHVGGRADLEAGLVRAVGEPTRRFAEDRLRMLRAVRFAARLGFAIEAETWSAMVAEARHLHAVSPERISQELEGIFVGPDPALGVALLETSGLGSACLPVSRRSDLSVCFARARGFELAPEARIALGWALVHVDVPREGLEDALRARKLSRSAMRVIRAALDAWDTVRDPARPRVDVLRWADGEHAPLVDALVASVAPPPVEVAWDTVPPRSVEAPAPVSSTEETRWREARAFLRAHPPANEARLGGKDLLAMGASPGPHLKDIIAQIEGAVLEGRVRTKVQAEALARTLIG